MIKCVLVDVDTVLISEVVEMDAELGDPNCKLIKPYLFESIDNMKPWPKATDQKELMITLSTSSNRHLIGLAIYFLLIQFYNRFNWIHYSYNPFFGDGHHFILS